MQRSRTLRPSRTGSTMSVLWMWAKSSSRVGILFPRLAFFDQGRPAEPVLGDVQFA